MKEQILYAFEYSDAAGSNAGKVLSSTLWNQSGVIYVSIDGKQTELEGSAYNKYCPTKSSGSESEPIRLITGCTNTSDAQIIYYWIEQKGYNFTFTVSDDEDTDYFYVKIAVYFCPSMESK